MRWRDGRRSDNIEDRRGSGMGGPVRIGGLGLIATVVIAWLMGANPSQIFGLVADNILGGGGSSNVNTAYQETGVEREQAEFVSVVMASTEDIWNPIFQEANAQYQEPKLVLFKDQTSSACGMSSSATGPFYCPGDRKVYIDLGFFNELRQMGASGEFARAYVIGHEVGHHVQNLLGITTQISRMQNQSSQRDSNALSVLLELQADCFAGVWANQAQRKFNILEQGDIEAGLQAAASIGDDRLQRMSGRAVNPDRFTHGSSEQRVQWFKTGLQYGDMNRCNTFASAR
ncbi:KPN_02809 family neutral zinc metallopeptidase [Thiolinea disciformis]|uniref:KPN_02809 family neutral zinc metallopeptidase n=1 Tax=Thiolinea disciformis TaxID=125614 RepID=UPI00037DB807|nr:neutral zinc metallopeptidase [Thiolinea disciformis]